MVVVKCLTLIHEYYSIIFYKLIEWAVIFLTEVENFGYAWQTGLRQGSRLVEICKHPVCTLTHEQMVDLLKTSMTVTVTVIPPHPDGSPRQGCNLTNCSYTFGR